MRSKVTMISLILISLLTLNGCQIQAADTNAFWPLNASSLRPLTSTLRYSRAPRWLAAQNLVTLQWDVVRGPAAGMSVSGDTVTLVAADEIVIRSRQTVGADFTLEVTLPADFGKTRHLPYIGLDPYPITPTGSNLWGINSLNDKIRVDGQSQTYSAESGDRILMEAKAGVVRYYKNHSGPTSTPFYVSKLPPITTNHPITIVKPIGGTIGDQWIAAIKVTN